MDTLINQLTEDNPQAVTTMRQNRQAFDTVFQAMFEADPVLRARAANAVEKVARDHPVWLRSHQEQIFRHLDKLSTPFSVKMATAMLISYLPLKGDTLSQGITILQHWLHTDANKFVKVNCLQALTNLALQHTWFKAEVIAMVEEEMVKGSAAIQARGRKLLQQLKK